MFENILSITGKPGLYKLLSRGNNNLIVESIDATHHRMPVFLTTKIISLDNIAMYTTEEELPLRKVMRSIQKKYNGGKCPVDYKNAASQELYTFLSEVMPNFDGDRIFPSDIRKLIQWYNILIENQLTDFSEEGEETPIEAAETGDAKAKAEPKKETKAKTTAQKSEQKAARKTAPKTAAKKAAPIKSANRKTN